jgi:hypothetical protein
MTNVCVIIVMLFFSCCVVAHSLITTGIHLACPMFDVIRGRELDLNNTPSSIMKASSSLLFMLCFLRSTLAFLPPSTECRKPSEKIGLLRMGLFDGIMKAFANEEVRSAARLVQKNTYRYYGMCFSFSLTSFSISCTIVCCTSRGDQSIG